MMIFEGSRGEFAVEVFGDGNGHVVLMAHHIDQSSASSACDQLYANAYPSVLPPEAIDDVCKALQEAKLEL